MISSTQCHEGTNLTLDMKTPLAARLSSLGDGLSEYCFTNLYLFRHIHEYKLLTGDYPCIAGKTYDGNKTLLPLFDLAEVPHRTLLNLIEGFDCFSPVSEQTLKNLDPEKFVSSYFRNDADYLYPAENFIHYRGQVLRKKKNLMQQYLKGGKVEAIRFSQSHSDHARQVLEAWQENKKKKPEETDYQACLEAVEHCETLELIGFMHYRDSRPAGFLLGKEIWPGVFAVHFAKGAKQKKGVFQYMFHHLAKSLEGTFDHYNFEQDLGLLNFRKTKKSYAPYRLLQKYRLRPVEC